MKKQIITTEKVDKTFDNVSCLLLRTIISSNKKNELEKFVIVTERCNYYDVEVPQSDENGNAILDAEGNVVIELIPTLKILDKKDIESVFTITNAEADALYLAIKDKVILGDSYTGFIDSIEQLSLLLKTQQDNPYGYGADKWEIYTPTV